MDEVNRPYFRWRNCPGILLTDEQFFYVKYKVYLAISIYWKNEISFVWCLNFFKSEHLCYSCLALQIDMQIEQY